MRLRSASITLPEAAARRHRGFASAANVGQRRRRRRQRPSCTRPTARRSAASRRAPASSRRCHARGPARPRRRPRRRCCAASPGTQERRAPAVQPTLLGRRHLVGAERRAVAPRRARLVRARRSRWSCGTRSRLGRCGLAARARSRASIASRSCAVDALRRASRRPAKRAPTSSVNESVGRAVDRDVVVVVEYDQLAQPEVAGERAGLGGDALHQVAVAGDHVGVVVDDVAAGPVEARARGSRSASAIPDGRSRSPAPAARSSSRRRGVLASGWPGRLRAPLAEALELVERQVVAGEVEQRVEQHRAVARPRARSGRGRASRGPAGRA